MGPEQVTVPTPLVGRTYLLGEEDYPYGSGPLLCRVTKVLRETIYANEPWWEVEAMVEPPPSSGVAYERVLYVKAASLTAARQGQR